MKKSNTNLKATEFMQENVTSKIALLGDAKIKKTMLQFFETAGNFSDYLKKVAKQLKNYGIKSTDALKMIFNEYKVQYHYNLFQKCNDNKPLKNSDLNTFNKAVKGKYSIKKLNELEWCKKAVENGFTIKDFKTHYNSLLIEMEFATSDNIKKPKDKNAYIMEFYAKFSKDVDISEYAKADLTKLFNKYQITYEKPLNKKS